MTKAFMNAKPDNNARQISGAEVSPVASLLQLGRKKTYVTFDDILKVFPYPEQDLDQLDRILAALIRVDIPIVEDASAASDSEGELED